MGEAASAGVVRCAGAPPPRIDKRFRHRGYKFPPSVISSGFSIFLSGRFAKTQFCQTYLGPVGKNWLSRGGREKDWGGMGGAEGLEEPLLGGGEAPERPPRASWRLLRLAGQEAGWLAAGCLVLIVRLPFSLVLPYLVSEGVIGALYHNENDKVLRYVVYFVVAGTVDAILDFFCVFLFSLTKAEIVRKLRLKLFDSMLRQEVAFYDESSTGDIMSRLTSDTAEMANDLTWVFRFSIEAVFRIAGITGYMFWRCPRLAAAACSVIPVIGLANKIYGNWLHRNAKKVQQTLADSNNVAQEVLSAFRTVASFANEPYESRRFADHVAKYFKLCVRQAAADGVYYMLVSTFLMNTIGQGTILAYGAYLCSKTRGDGNLPYLTVPQLVAFLAYRGDLQNWSNMLFDSFSNLVKSSGASLKVFELLEREPRKTPHAGLRPKARGNVTFRDVNFCYPARPEVEVLQGVTFQALPGTVTAFVGSSGAGKSTVFHLLEGFYEPSSGEVLVDGNSVASLDPLWLHRTVGLVGQEPVLFSGSICRNILYGLIGEDGEMPFPENFVPPSVIEAAKAANLHEFITGLPRGYMTKVGEKGVQLSGGQKQRVAIARALVQDPKILLLDEATSALDAESEAAVQEALERAMEGRTTLVIAHRLSTIASADQILVLNRGRIVESGVHQELMEGSRVGEHGTYSSLVQRQTLGRDPGA